jgi:hypothetical protein
MNLVTILLIVSLVSAVIGAGGVKGCLSERQAKIVAQEETKRLKAVQAVILKAVENQKEVREHYEREKNRLDGISGPALDAELDELLSETPAPAKPKKPGAK